MTETSSRPARRLLVALDASRESLNVLDAAADLAARLQAEIQGLFVEDTDLLDLANDPLVRSFNPNDGRAQVFSGESMERSLRRLTADARRALDRAAKQRQVSYTFDVRRGRAAHAVSEEAGDEDLIVICRTAASAEMIPTARTSRAGATAREVVSHTARSVLIVNERARVFGEVFAAYDGSEAAKTALETAGLIVDRRGGGSVSVLILADTDDNDQRLQAEASAIIGNYGHAASFHRIHTLDLKDLCAAASKEPSSVLVLGEAQPVVKNAGADGLLEQISCSVLLVR